MTHSTGYRITNSPDPPAQPRGRSGRTPSPAHLGAKPSTTTFRTRMPKQERGAATADLKRKSRHSSRPSRSGQIVGLDLRPRNVGSACQSRKQHDGAGTKISSHGAEKNTEWCTVLRSITLNRAPITNMQKIFKLPEAEEWRNRFLSGAGRFEEQCFP